MASSSRLSPLRGPRRPSRSVHLSPPSATSSDPQPAPQPESKPRSTPSPRTRTTEPVARPKKVDSSRKTPQFDPNPLSRDQRKDVFDKRKIMMEEFTKFLPSQTGKVERPDDHDSEPLHNYGQSILTLGTVQLGGRGEELERRGAQPGEAHTSPGSRGMISDKSDIGLSSTRTGSSSRYRADSCAVASCRLLGRGRGSRRTVRRSSPLTQLPSPGGYDGINCRYQGERLLGSDAALSTRVAQLSSRDRQGRCPSHHPTNVGQDAHPRLCRRPPLQRKPTL